MEQKYGIGLEMEGFIVNGDKGKEFIENQPASEWVKTHFAKKYPDHADKISLEQASVMLELKTDVHTEDAEAVEEVLKLREMVNKLLSKHSCQLVFRPVLDKEFDFVAATSDHNSRTHQLIAEWSKQEEGWRLLYSTAIASLQVNDSRPFAGLKSEQEKWEKARKIHNLYSKNFDLLNQQNALAVDLEGRSRMENLFHLLESVKRTQFANRGFDKAREALIPTQFDTVRAMQKWMAAHSDVDLDIDGLDKVKDKNEHAVTVKIKREPWVAETRVYDAVDSEKEIRRIVEFNRKFLEKLI